MSSSISESLKRAARPIAKRVIYRSLRPVGPVGPLYRAAGEASFWARELYWWGHRSLVATPLFLARCARYGDDIAVDRVPFIDGDLRLELGSNIRISGHIGMTARWGGTPTIVIGDGVFIGHSTTFTVASRIEIGKYVSISSGCHISDTEGHAHYDPQRPIWEVAAGADDVKPVVIEDGVQIAKHCMILKGVTIGARSVVGAGTVIRSDIPPDSIVMGNPARVLKRAET
jgi:acetyltransferase-like isoleucine patch superfamily enzyme